MGQAVILRSFTARSFSALAALNTAVFSWANETGASMLNDVEKQLLQDLETQNLCTEQVHESWAMGIPTRISLKRNRHGNPVFRYGFGPSRVDRRTFQTLTCTEIRCPQRQALWQQWQVHTGLVTPTVRPAAPTPQFRFVLAAEEHITWANRIFIAREALFPVTLNCAHHVHEPLRISIKGWDVFGPGGYLAGGWFADGPMFASLEQVKAWLQAQHPTADLTPATSGNRP
jgi:hypothetical protein